jgi:hypothetical protein
MNTRSFEKIRLLWLSLFFFAKSFQNNNNKNTHKKSAKSSKDKRLARIRALLQTRKYPSRTLELINYSSRSSSYRKKVIRKEVFLRKSSPDFQASFLFSNSRTYKLFESFELVRVRASLLKSLSFAMSGYKAQNKLN